MFMSDTMNSISRRVHEREMRRQLFSNRIRKAIARYTAGYIPAIVAEFLKMLGSSLLGFFVISRLLAFFFHVQPLYLFSAVGLVYSLQATYHKFRLSRDPAYKIPKCRCKGRGNDNTEAVLRSKHSAVLRIPNSAWGSLFYAALLVITYLKHAEIAALAAAAALAASTYLSYVMVTKIRSLCVNCINTSALNLLIFLHVVVWIAR